VEDRILHDADQAGALDRVEARRAAELPPPLLGREAPLLAVGLERELPDRLQVLAVAAGSGQVPDSKQGGVPDELGDADLLARSLLMRIVAAFSATSRA
jgi:hypothetical protein